MILTMKAKENNKIICRKILQNLIIINFIFLYLLIAKFIDTKISSIVILFISIIIFEVAYHKDDGIIAIYGIEILVLAFHTLIMRYIIVKNNIFFGTYINYLVIVIIIYYMLKMMIIYTNEKRKYVKSLSDIHEIVNKEPIKKEAKKRENK